MRPAKVRASKSKKLPSKSGQRDLELQERLARELRKAEGIRIQLPIRERMRLAMYTGCGPGAAPDEGDERQLRGSCSELRCVSWHTHKRDKRNVFPAEISGGLLGV